MKALEVKLASLQIGAWSCGHYRSTALSWAHRASPPRCPGNTVQRATQRVPTVWSGSRRAATTGFRPRPRGPSLGAACSGYLVKPRRQRMVRYSSVAWDGAVNEHMFESCKGPTHDLADWRLQLAPLFTTPSCRDNLWRSSGRKLCTQCSAKTFGYNCGLSINIMMRPGARSQRYKSSLVVRGSKDGSCCGQTDTFED